MYCQWEPYIGGKFRCRNPQCMRITSDPTQLSQCLPRAPEQRQPKIGVGTELKRLLRKFGLVPTPNCPCNQRAIVMDSEGIEWCEKHIELITDWLQEEAVNRKLPFLRIAARVLIRRAIKNAKKKLATLPK